MRAGACGPKPLRPTAGPSTIGAGFCAKLAVLSHLAAHTGALRDLLPMSTYKELLLQQQKLDQQIAQAREKEAREALAHVKSVVQEYGFTAQQVFPWTPQPLPRAKKKAPIKYRNPLTGAGWSGRGREPHWLAGKDRSAYAVPPQALDA